MTTSLSLDPIAVKQANYKIYEICFPNGLKIQFKLLNWQEFRNYSDLLTRGLVPPNLLETAIYKQCVLNPRHIEDAGSYYAGVVSTVATVVMHLSGPMAVDDITNSLERAREKIDTIESQITMIICRAFPSYTPEDISTMSWDLVALRLAQAERILMTKQPPELAEPLRIEKAGEKQKKFDVESMIHNDNAGLARVDSIGGVGPGIHEVAAMRAKRRQKG